MKRLGEWPGPSGIREHELIADSADLLELAEPFEIKLPFAGLTP